MPERANKTIMCSVLFLDIPNYSRMSVSGQIELKERFNEYLSSVIARVPPDDRIILDTGDGAAINFLGDVEDALKVALALDDCLHTADPELEPRLSLRMGINLGPVRLIRDINGQPNIVGDGINVAQRIMAFADIGQILVSRSYHDAVSRLSPEYTDMLHHLGMRTDKHVREHEIYALISEGRAAPSRKTAGRKNMGRSLISYWDALADRLDDQVDHLVERFQQASLGRRAAYAGGIIGPVVLVVVLIWKYWLPVGGEPFSLFAQSPEKAAVQSTEVEPTPTPKENAWYKNVLGSKRSGEIAHIIVQCAVGSQIFVDGASKGKIERGSLKVEVSAGVAHAVIITGPEGEVHSQEVNLAVGQTRHVSPRGCR